MARTKQNSLKQHEKVLKVMLTGKPVSLEEFETTLGKEIEFYRISTYIWNAKAHCGAVIKSVKTGRKVSGYQLVNVEDSKAFMAKLEAGHTKAKVVVAKKVAAKVAVKVAPVAPVKAKKAKTTAISTLDELKSVAAEVVAEEKNVKAKETLVVEEIK